MKARDLLGCPVRHVGTTALARPLAGLLGDSGRFAHQPIAPRFAQQRGAHPRDRDTQRAGVDAERPAAQPHRLHRHGAAAAERIDHPVALRAERRHRAARDRRVHAARVAVKPVRQRALERAFDLVEAAERARRLGLAAEVDGTAQRRERAPLPGRRRGPLRRRATDARGGLNRSTLTTRTRPRAACRPHPPWSARCPCRSPAGRPGSPADSGAGRRAARPTSARRRARGCG